MSANNREKIAFFQHLCHTLKAKISALVLISFQLLEIPSKTSNPNNEKENKADFR